MNFQQNVLGVCKAAAMDAASNINWVQLANLLLSNVQDYFMVYNLPPSLCSCGFQRNGVGTGC